ncbi:hypothetical protein ES702_02896 [subsurface metagenome]
MKEASKHSSVLENGYLPTTKKGDRHLFLEKVACRLSENYYISFRTKKKQKNPLRIEKHLDKTHLIIYI